MLRVRSRFGLSLGSLLLLFACGGKVLSVSPEKETDFDASNPPWVPDGSASTSDARADADATPVVDAWIDNTPTSDLVVINLGSVFGLVQTPFTIPPNALGFNITATAAVAIRSFSILDIVAPSGDFVHKNAVPWNGTNETSATFFGNLACAGVPQSAHPEAMPVAAGSWQVSVNGAANISVSVQTTPDGAFHGGLLDVNFYVPEGLLLGDAIKPVNAASAPFDQEVQVRVTSFFDVVKALYGISRGRVKYVPLPSRFTEITENDLSDAWEATVPTDTGRGAHVILSQAADSWWGIAAGIPGVANTPGTNQSGVILASLPSAQPAEEGYVLAHELGHYMGLSHTSEFDDNGFDPLDDTPQCPGLSWDTVRQCPDITNTMAAAGATFSPVVASPLQQKVIQGSPIYRAFLTGTPPTSGQARVPPVNWKKIFGHPNTELSAGERYLATHSCGSTKRGHIADAQTRSALAGLRTNTTLPRFARTMAERLLAR